MTKNKQLDRKRYMFAYVPGNSIFHKLNPISKLIFLILLTTIVLVVNSILFLAIIFLIVFSLAILSGIKLKLLFRKLRYIFMILIVSVLLNISEGTSKSNLSRARTILQEKIFHYSKIANKVVS